MNILVTGGAGFIGSHLIDILLEQGNTIVCLDDLSRGRRDNISHHEVNPRFTFIKKDISVFSADYTDIFRQFAIDIVYHLAANSDIGVDSSRLFIDYERTFMTTLSTLHSMLDAGVKNIVFASSSAIYGERSTVLTEDMGPLQPISLYGAAKLSSEAYIAAFCHNFGLMSWIIRFPNVVGERTTHGVIYDFIRKLKQQSNKLIILGDGNQTKPYLYVKDLVQAILFIQSNTNERVNCFNVGVETATSVKRIAEIVVEKMKLSDVEFIYTGGDRGWQGDVPRFLYDLRKIHTLGWRAALTSDEAIRAAVQAELEYQS